MNLCTTHKVMLTEKISFFLLLMNLICVSFYSCSSTQKADSPKKEKWFYWPSEYNDLHEKNIALEKEFTVQKKTCEDEILSRDQKLRTTATEKDSLEKEKNEKELKVANLSKRIIELEGNLNDEFANGKIEIKSTDKQIDINIPDRIFFTSGSSKLKKRSNSILNKISNFLMNYSNHKIVIEGHTDNIPLKHNKKFKSNWQLSNERANAVLTQLLKNTRLNPSNFSMKGYGEYQPLVPNTTYANRSINRRVNIVITQ